MAQLFTNAARSPLMANILAADTSLTVDAALADLFPVANTGTDPVPTAGKDYFKIVLENAAHEKEIVYVRTRALGAPIFSNVIRGQEGTTARAYTAGDIVGLRHTAVDLAGAIDLAANATTAGKALLNSASAIAQRATLEVAPRATRIDVASVAGTVDLTTTAPNTDDIRITGALAITAFTVAVGRVIRVTAGGAFSLANNASIVTQTGATLTLAVGDSLSLRATAANVVEVIGFTRAGARGIAQIVTSSTGAVATGTTNTPYDDTIPQITEGDQYLSVTITPKNAGSTLIVSGQACISSSLQDRPILALHQDAIASALIAIESQMPSAGYSNPIPFRHEMTAGSTGAITFKIRVGSVAGATLTLNGTSGARKFGGVQNSFITVEELLP